MTPTTDHTTAKLDIMDDDTLDRAFATAKAHAAELREWAQKWWDAWNTQDLDGVVALVDEDIVYEDPAMLGEHIRGRAQFRAFVEMFFRAFPDAVFVVQIHVAISAPQLPRVWTSEDHCEARLTVTSTDQYPGWWSGNGGEPRRNHACDGSHVLPKPRRRGLKSSTITKPPFCMYARRAAAS